MELPGKLKQDLRRIYGANDPLNYIEDIEAQERMDGSYLQVTLRVPSHMQRYMPDMRIGMTRFPHFAPTRSLEECARCYAEIFGIVSPGVPKAPENKATESKKESMADFAKPERILFSGPKTIVFWPDGSKTVVSLGEGQEYDEYTAFCSAVVKKMFGATHKAKKFLESIKVIQKPKAKKAKSDEPIEEEVLADDE